MIWVGLDFWAGVSSAYSFFGAMVALGLGSSHPSFPLPARGSGAPQCSRSMHFSLKNGPLPGASSIFINMLAFAIHVPVARV